MIRFPGKPSEAQTNPLDKVVLEATGNKAVCSGLPHSVSFDGLHLSQRNIHQRALLLGFIEGTLILVMLNKLRCHAHF